MRFTTLIAGIFIGLMALSPQARAVIAPPGDDCPDETKQGPGKGPRAQAVAQAQLDAALARLATAQANLATASDQAQLAYDALQQAAQFAADAAAAIAPAQAAQAQAYAQLAAAKAAFYAAILSQPGIDLTGYAATAAAYGVDYAKNDEYAIGSKVANLAAAYKTIAQLAAGVDLHYQEQARLAGLEAPPDVMAANRSNAQRLADAKAVIQKLEPSLSLVMLHPGHPDHDLGANNSPAIASARGALAIAQSNDDAASAAVDSVLAKSNNANAIVAAAQVARANASAALTGAQAEVNAAQADVAAARAAVAAAADP